MAGKERSFWVYFKGDLGDLQRKTKTAEQGLKASQQRIGKTMTAIGASMTAVGAGIVGTLGLAVKEGVKFESVMAEVASLGVEDMVAWEKGVRNVARAYGQDLTLAGKASYDVASGLTKDAIASANFLEVAAKAATVGVTDMQTAGSLGIDIMNAFGLELSDSTKVFDQAFKAVDVGKTTFPELAAGVGHLAATFANAGLESSDLLAAVSSLTKGAFRTREGFTAMKAAVSNIIKPSNEAEKAAKRLEIQFDAIALREKGFGGFMKMVTEAIAKSGEDATTVTSELFGSVEGFGAMLSLTGKQADVLAENLKSTAHETGVLDRAYEKFTENNFAQKWREIFGQLRDIGLSVYGVLQPTLKSLSESIWGVVKSIADWAQQNPKWVSTLTWLGVAVGGISLALGSLLLVLGPLMIAMPGLIASWGLLAGIGWAGLAAGISSVAGALAAIVAVGGIGWAFGSWIDGLTSNTAFGRWIDDMADKLVSLIQRLKEWLGLAAEADPYGNETPEERNRRARQEAGLGPSQGPVSGGVRSINRDALSSASRIVSQGSGLVRQAMPAMALAGAGSGGGVNLNITFGDVRVRETADVDRIADAITRRAYDMLAQRGIRR